METTKSKKQIQREELEQFAQLLKDNGFTVIVSKLHPFEWLFFEKDNKIGTVSASHFFGYNFGTVHRPCRECGTGYGIAQESELSLELANASLIHHPNWAYQSDIKAIRKYKDAKDYIDSNKWAEYYIL